MRSYKITAFDKSPADIAARFHVDPQMLLEQNVDVFSEGGDEGIRPIPPKLVGTVIRVPYDEDYSNGWHWEVVLAKPGETLDALCARLNKDLSGINRCSGGIGRKSARSKFIGRGYL